MFRPSGDSMRRYFRISAAFICLWSACALPANAQDREAAATPECPIPKKTDADIKWGRFELGPISVCIPETLVRRRTDRCGERCFIFENEEMYFDADPSVSAWRPTFEKKYPTFAAEKTIIEGKDSTLWHFEDTGEYKFVYGVNIVLERGQIGLGVYLFSKSADSKPLADRIFRSIRFMKADTN